jgi:hypothetical protein
MIDTSTRWDWRTKVLSNRSEGVTLLERLENR